jgi:protein TonB
MIGAGLPPANDRMLTTCFLAALIHGIVILGVTFSSPGMRADGGAAGLEVVLVNDQAPAAASNPNAQYLSERTQHGSGNTLKHERTAFPAATGGPRSRPAPM